MMLKSCTCIMRETSTTKERWPLPMSGVEGSQPLPRLSKITRPWSSGESRWITPACFLVFNAWRARRM